MYNMKIKLLGSKVRFEIIALCVILGILIGSILLCSCNNEGFHNAAPVNAPNGLYDFSKHGAQHNKAEMQNQPNNPMISGQKFFWANNEFRADCCDYSSVSGTGGCACVTDEQMKYLHSRGGNRSTSENEF